MIGPNERIYWRGSPDKLAAVMNPGILLGFIIAAGAFHPAVLTFISGSAGKLGIGREIATATAYVPGLLAGIKALWMYLAETTKVYLLTAERLVLRHGVFLRIEDEIELYRVVDAIQRVSLFQRVIGVGTVIVKSNDHTGTVTMNSIKDSSKVRNGLRKLAERCKSRRGVRVLE